MASSLNRRRGVRQRHPSPHHSGMSLLSELTGIRREVLLMMAAFCFAMAVRGVASDGEIASSDSSSESVCHASSVRMADGDDIHEDDKIFSMGIFMGSHTLSPPPSSTTGVPHPKSPADLTRARQLVNRLRGDHGEMKSNTSAGANMNANANANANGMGGEWQSAAAAAAAEKEQDHHPPPLPTDDDDDDDDEKPFTTESPNKKQPPFDDDDENDNNENAALQSTEEGQPNDDDANNNNNNNNDGNDDDTNNNDIDQAQTDDATDDDDVQNHQAARHGRADQKDAAVLERLAKREAELVAMKHIHAGDGPNVNADPDNPHDAQPKPPKKMEGGEQEAHSILAKHFAQAEAFRERNHNLQDGGDGTSHVGMDNSGLFIDAHTYVSLPNVFYNLYKEPHEKIILSAWIRLHPKLEEETGKKRIFSLGPEGKGCMVGQADVLAGAPTKHSNANNNNNNKHASPMLRLYVNHEGTADNALILEYHTGAPGSSCYTLTSEGVRVVPFEWTQVGVSLDPKLMLFRLYVNGEKVAEEQKPGEDFPAMKHVHRASEKVLDVLDEEATLFVGRGVEQLHEEDLNLQDAPQLLNALEGEMTNLAFWTKKETLANLPVEEEFVKKVFGKGHGSVQGLKDLKPNHPDWLYPMKVDVPGLREKNLDKALVQEMIRGKHGSLKLVLHANDLQLPPVPEPPKKKRIKQDHPHLRKGLHDKHPKPNPSRNSKPDSFETDENPFADWKPQGGFRYGEYVDGTSPEVITEEMKRESDALARKRREYVKNAMKHVWKGYKKYAWGYDELKPISRGNQNNWGGMATTMVDSLDTLWLMGMKEEFYEARDWIRDHLSNDHIGDVSVFETTIRSLGGLLSAYDWSGDAVFMEKAEDLGKRLFHAFDSKNGIPYGHTVLNGHHSSNQGWLRHNALLAELGTLQIEFRYLAEATGKKEYATKSNRVFDMLAKANPPHGLYPIYIRNDVDGIEFGNGDITFGAMGDSFYEYLLKVWLQGGKKETLYREMYDKAMDGVADKLLHRSTPSGLAYIADMKGKRLEHKMDHLVCFMGGLLALGAYTHPDGLDSPQAQRDLKTGKALAYTCYQMYARMPTGLSPEYVQFSGGSDFGPGHARYYILRPETVESFFILNYLTGDPIYREWGWEVFQAIERYCRTKVGYGHRHDVRNTDDEPEDHLESFFLAETLKYLYLLQDPDTEVDILNKHVFNTEAHPLRKFDQPDLMSDLASLKMS